MIIYKSHSILFYFWKNIFCIQKNVDGQFYLYFSSIIKLYFLNIKLKYLNLNIEICIKII